MGGQTYQQKIDNDNAEAARKKREADKSNFEWRWRNYLRSATGGTPMGRDIYLTRPRSLIWWR